MSGEKRYFLDTNAIVMASAKATNSVLLTRDRQVLNAGLCATREF